MLHTVLTRSWIVVGTALMALAAVSRAEESAPQWQVLVSQHRVLGTRIPQELRDHIHQVDMVAPMWLGAADDGTLAALEGCSGPYDHYRRFVQENGSKLLPIIRNFAPQPLLANPEAIDRFVQNAARLAEAEQFDGFVVDFEQLKGISRQPLVDMMARLYPLMKAQDRVLGIAVAPKPWEKEWDYLALSQHSDFLYVMTYDYVGPWNKVVGPTSPMKWPQRHHDIERDLDDILKLGVEPRKVLMGLPLYGADFKLDPANPQQHVAVTPLYLNQIAELQEKHSAARQWDDQKKAAWFEYTADDGSRHQTWYDDAESFTAKIADAQRRGLGGLALWAIRYPEAKVGDPFWAVVPSRSASAAAK